MDLRAYIEERSIPEPMSGCWLWLRSIGSHGYGNASAPNARVTVAHRVSFEAFIGPIPPGALVQHSCDNKWCVAPHHLSLGDDASNAKDKQRKGRAAKKLNAESVMAITRACAAGASQLAVAKRFGINQRVVFGIVSGRIWGHVTGLTCPPGLCAICRAGLEDARFAQCLRCRTTAEARKKERRLRHASHRRKAA